MSRLPFLALSSSSATGLTLPILELTAYHVRMGFVLRADLIVRYRISSGNQPENEEKIARALRDHFKTDDASAVIDGSEWFSRNASLWKRKVCFGHQDPNFCFLVWVNGSSQFQVAVEITDQIPFEDACDQTLERVLSALNASSIKSSLKSAELKPYSDKRPILLGRRGMLAELLEADTRNGILGSIVVFAGFTAVSLLLWKSQAASLVAGNVAPASSMVILALSAIIRGRADRIKWYPSE